MTWINGPLIGFVKLAFDLDTDAKAFLVTFVFYIAYLVFAHCRPRSSSSAPA